jgi:hypothetical protein
MIQMGATTGPSNSAHVKGTSALVGVVISSTTGVTISAADVRFGDDASFDTYHNCIIGVAGTRWGAAGINASTDFKTSGVIGTTNRGRPNAFDSDALSPSDFDSAPILKVANIATAARTAPINPVKIDICNGGDHH